MDSEPKRVVIVDDEPVILELLSTLFEDDDGYELVTCTNGREGLAVMEAGQVDVLLTDKNLPDIGGLDLLAHAKAIRPDCEVILITGYASLDTALTAMQLGAFDYIVKPPRSIFDVKRKVDQAIQRQAILRENRHLVRELADRNEALAEKNAALVDAMRRLQSTQDELVQAEKLAGIGTLAAGVAHEISSPLFGILGLAETIQEEDDATAVREYASEIVEYTNSIRDIVDSLTGYSRKVRDEQPGPVLVAAVVRDAVKLVARSLAVREGMIRVDLDDTAVVTGRAGELQQIFVNLVKNAVEAVTEHRGELGFVDVRVHHGIYEGQQAVFASVEDQGHGIEDTALGSIFDPFYTTKQPGKGTGLGLNIVYRIMTRMDGHVHVQSTVGEGTAFTLRWPVGR
ncbi:MAG: response regulator [Myxococcota bacterium]